MTHISRGHAPRPPLLHASLAVLPLLLLLLLVAHGVTPSAAAAGTDEKSSVCAGVDASLAELRSVVADLSSLITHASITPITSSIKSRRREEGWEDGAELEMDEYSVQLRVRLPRAVAKTENAAQGKVQHEHSHNRNQSRTIITSASPPSSRQQLPSRAAMLLHKLISASTIDSGAVRAGAVEELLGSLLAPLQRSLSPLCAESEEGGHGNSNDDEDDDDKDEQTQPEFVGLARDGDGDAGNSVIDSNQHEDTHGSMGSRGGMDSTQPVQFPHLMPNFSTVAPSREHSKRFSQKELNAEQQLLISPSLPSSLRLRREDTENRVSYECPLSSLLTQAARHQGAANVAQVVFEEACRKLDGTETIFNGLANAVFLSIIVDYSEEVSISQETVSALEAYVNELYFTDIHLSIAVHDWRVILLQLLRDIQWRERIFGLHVSSRLRAAELVPGSLPADAFHRFGSAVDIVLSHPGLVSLPAGVFDNNQALQRLQILDTQITMLPPAIFSRLSFLLNLQLINNPIVTLQQGIFDGLLRLQTLFLARTKLGSLPAHIVRSLSGLLFLFLSDNSFRALPPSFFVDLPQLHVLDLSSNRLTTLPDQFPAHISNLNHVDLRNNDLTALPDAFFARVSEIDSLLLTNNPRLDLDAQQLDHLQQPRILRFTKVSIRGDIESVFAAKADVWNLTTLTIGWEGLREDVLTIQTICKLLNDTTDLLSITYSSYEAFERCEGKSISSLILAYDEKLKSVTVGDHIRLDLSYSSSLTTLTATGRIPTVDVSGTNLPYSTLFCDELGSAAFAARQMLNIDDLEPELLLRQCFEEGSIFDFSENEHPFFGAPSALTATIPQRIVFGENEQHFFQFFEDTGRTPELFRTSVPTFLFDTESIVCQVDFEQVELFSLDFDPVVAATSPVLTFSTTCNCAGGYRVDSDGLCELIPTRPPIVAIVVSAIVFPIVTLGIQFAIRWYRRKQRERYDLLQENELQERLLSKANEDVAALKQGWRISLDEVHLINKVDEGAFGAVWRGDWEGVAVAVKFLKLAAGGSMGQFMRDDIEKEVDFLQRTRHTNLVRFFGTGTDRHGAPFLVLEFVDLGSLKHLLHESGLDSAIMRAKALSRSRSHSSSAAEEAFVLIPSPDASPSATFALRVKSAASLKLCLVRDIVDGMAFLHSLDVMHRDLKSGNVLVNKRLVAKITDFGSMSGKLSRIQQEAATDSNTHASAPVAETRLEYSPESMNKTVCLTMTDGVGTPLYMAPEILDPQLRKLSLKADVFSFGVLMWEISECRVPDLLAQEIGDDFSGFVMQTLLQLYRDGKHLHFGDFDDIDDIDEDKHNKKRDDDGSSSSSSSCPMWYQTLSLLCMSFSPSDRPSFEQIKARINENDIR